eukprot:6186747-Pleurochrysis_carterae.AAC.3
MRRTTGMAFAASRHQASDAPVAFPPPVPPAAGVQGAAAATRAEDEEQMRGAGRLRMSGHTSSGPSHTAYMANLLNEDLIRGIGRDRRAHLRARVRDRRREAAVQLPAVGQNAYHLRGGAGGAAQGLPHPQPDGARPDAL